MFPYGDIKIGVLALQGDFERHLYRLDKLGVTGCEIRTVDDLKNLDAMIIPGGESTTFSCLIDRFDLRGPLMRFCREKPVWGTCAGMVLMAREVSDPRVRPLQMVNMAVERNGYGRQIHSFFATVSARLNGTTADLSASFIRAPKVLSLGPEVTVLAEHEALPVLLKQGRYLVNSFHTELDADLFLTRYFVDNFVLT